MRKIRVGVLVAKRGAVTMTTVVQEVARVTRLGKDTPERHLSEKFNPEIKISYLHTPQLHVCVCSRWLLPSGAAGACCHGYSSIPIRMQDEIQNPGRP